MAAIEVEIRVGMLAGIGPWMEHEHENDHSQERAAE